MSLIERHAMQVDPRLGAELAARGHLEGPVTRIGDPALRAAVALACAELEAAAGGCGADPLARETILPLVRSFAG